MDSFLRKFNRWTAGSFCAGTESPCCVSGAFCAALNSVFGIDVEVNHVFTCEKNHTKREFIKLAHRGKFIVMLGDIAGFRGRNIKNLLTGGLVEVARLGVDIVWAGFPCQAASTKNSKRWTELNDNCIELAALGTGMVFDALVSFFADHMTKIVFLENVFGLRGRNLEACRLKLQKVGIILIVFETDSDLFGAIQSRPRLWMIGIAAWYLFSFNTTRELHPAERVLLQQSMAQCPAVTISTVLEHFSKFLIATTLINKCFQCLGLEIRIIWVHRRDYETIGWMAAGEA